MTGAEFLERSNGLFGGPKKLFEGERRLSNLAQQTQFPSWNTLKKLKPSNEERKNSYKNRNTKDESEGKDLIQKKQNSDHLNEEQIKQNPKVDPTEDLLKDLSRIHFDRNRRSSDSSVINRKMEEKKKKLSPSHYKGKRRGTYAAVYDPRVTLTRPRSDTRSRSLFIKSDEMGSPSQSDLRIRLLKSFHNNKSLSLSDASLSSDEEGAVIKNNNNQLPRASTVGATPCQKKHRHQYSSSGQRAQSTISHLPKEHLEYLERKYEESKLKQNLNESQEFSDTLHKACREGNYEKIQELINDGQDVNESDIFGHAPCYYAILNGHFECVSLLVSNGANLDDYFQKQKQQYFSHC
eukprot:TCONS_00073044-protein